MTRQEMDVPDVTVINEAARRPSLAPALDPGGRGIRWASGPCSAALAVVARDAVDLLASEKLARVRECAAANCSLLFLDESRAGRRRWCAMTRCGNRAKAAAAYRRRRGG
jgi:predicted RNA-binding Zn ribbon-like protein